MNEEEARRKVNDALIEIEGAFEDTKYLAKYLNQRQFADPAYESAIQHLKMALAYLQGLPALLKEESEANEK